MSRSKGRAGRPWRRVRAAVLAASTTCWLCGRPIDLDLPVTHRMSATVDHVDPISLGGDPLNPALLRPAHRSCNSSRGNRPPKPRRRQSRDW
ncbi:HNH endonuclease signature motif containing protein [Acrocarpospora phusangensis]|uniref:HNH endonuclease signature motif containing protein n=1 Tax=Acrocarpospora phusangensis TaxID=1070424 RepID=UPI0035A24265